MLCKKTAALFAGIYFSLSPVAYSQAAQDPSPPVPALNPLPGPITAPTNQGQTRDATSTSPDAAQNTMNSDVQQPVVPMPALSDGQIASIVKASNDAEIKAGKMVLKSGQSQDVKNFAKMMVDDHSAANRDLKSIAAKRKINRNSSDVKVQMADKVKASEARLQGLKAAALDKTYIDEQVIMHQDVLTTIDTLLLTNAKDADLKALLEKIRPKVASHLDQARALQSSPTAGR